MVQKLCSKDYFYSSAQTIAIEPRTPQYVFPEHTHNFHEIVVVTEGTGLHVLNGKPHNLHSGMFFYIHASDHHLFEQVNNLKLTNILFRNNNHFNYLTDISPLLPNEELNPTSHWWIDTTDPKIEQLLSQLTENDTTTSAAQECLFFQLLLLLQKNRYLPQSHTGSVQQRVQQLLNWLKINYAQDVEWDNLVENYALSLRTLHRYIKTSTGLTPQRYLTKIRLSEAYYQIKHSERNITDIALSCGFNDSTYFSTCFKNEFNVTPRDIRHSIN